MPLHADAIAEVETDGRTYWVPCLRDENNLIVWRGDSERDSYRERDNAVDHATATLKRYVQQQERNARP